MPEKEGMARAHPARHWRAIEAWEGRSSPAIHMGAVWKVRPGDQISSHWFQLTSTPASSTALPVLG